MDVNVIKRKVDHSLNWPSFLKINDGKMFKNKYTVGTKDFTKSNGYQKGTTFASNKNGRKNKTKKVYQNSTFSN